MPRKPRIHIPYAFYHAILRGNNKQNIFVDEEDRSYLCLKLQEGLSRFSHKIHAFCFMTNHIHLLIQVCAYPLGDIIHHFSSIYARTFNRHYDRIGHLFQGRFKAQLVRDEKYLLDLIRYIHLNPVRANIVTDPADYLWSSHRAHIGKWELPWLEKSLIEKKFPTGAQYQQFIESNKETPYLIDYEAALTEPVLLFEEENPGKIGKRTERKSKLSSKIGIGEIVTVVCHLLKVDEWVLCSRNQEAGVCRARRICVFLALQAPKVRISEVARALKRDKSVISRIGETAKATMLADMDERVIIQKCLSLLSLI